ncbi:MAG: hypothetical protein WAL84_15040, partial [Candidatus Dormiibacterota bacterium]
MIVSSTGWMSATVIFSGGGTWSVLSPADAPPHREGIEKYALAADLPVGMAIIRVVHCARHVLVM